MISEWQESIWTAHVLRRPVWYVNHNLLQAHSENAEDSLRRGLPMVRNLVLRRHMAEWGISVGQVVSLHLSRWADLRVSCPWWSAPRNSAAVPAAADAVLHVIDMAVPVFVDGHSQALRERVRHEEAIRRELIEDLLRGDVHFGELVERA